MEFAHPILNASGCWSADLSQIDTLMRSNLSAVVLKTCTLYPREGNPEPNFSQKSGVCFNCKGVPNNGYAYYRAIAAHYHRMKPIILSVLVDDFKELREILEDYNQFSRDVRLVELNISCPNGNQRIIGYHLKDLLKLLLFLKDLSLKNLIYSLKLPPILEGEKIINIGWLLLEYRDIIKFIVCCNSIPIGYTPELSKEYGGMSSTPVNKYLAMGNIHKFSKILNGTVKIIGCGGISSVEDVREFLDAGADYVQVASAFYDTKTDSLDCVRINQLIRGVLRA